VNLSKRGKAPPGLMLTPLLDMFTIILIFLLVSMDGDMVEFKRGVADLPSSEARGKFKPAVNVDITPEGILVDPVPGLDDKDPEGNLMSWRAVIGLNQGIADPRYYAQEEIPELTALFEAHMAERKLRFEKLVRTASAKGQEPPKDEAPILLIQADAKMPYKTLYLVLQSASRAGFGKYRLATVQGQ
jgi:biopolymer transport protein ExbD